MLLVHCKTILFHCCPLCSWNSLVSLVPWFRASWLLLHTGKTTLTQHQRASLTCCNPHLLCLFCRRRCQSGPPQWHQPSQGPDALFGGEDGGTGPVEQQDRVYSVSRRLHHRPGQHVALPVPLLQKWRRWVEEELCGWRKELMYVP